MNTTDAEIVQGIDVQHLTEDFDRVAIERQPDGELVALPGREDDLPFESYKIVADEIALRDYDRVCEYVTEQLRFSGSLSFADGSRTTQSSGFEKVDP